MYISMDLINKKYKSFFILMKEKEEFMLLVFSNLIFQIGLTFYFMEKTTIILNIFEKYALYSLIIGLLLIIVIMKLNPMIKFIFFSIFSILLGIIISFMKNILCNVSAMWFNNDDGGFVPLGIKTLVLLNSYHPEFSLIIYLLGSNWK